ncbi:MAG: hypothetical protein LBP24_03355 [Coriobacteriales bacterium]|nr:hypothetical protein [Coriobacteriales bacterium]
MELQHRGGAKRRPKGYACGAGAKAQSAAPRPTAIEIEGGSKGVECPVDTRRAKLPEAAGSPPGKTEGKSFSLPAPFDKK